jgi:hypothetical protein
VIRKAAHSFRPGTCPRRPRPAVPVAAIQHLSGDALAPPGQRPGIRLRNTAELSGELSRGDVVVAGEAPLIVERFGFTPLRGPFTPAAVHDDGTHPLDDQAPAPSHPGPRPGRPRNRPPSPNWRTQ